MHINVMHVEVRGQHMGGQLLLWYGSQELRGLWLGGEVLFALFCFCKCLEQLIGPISYFFFFFETSSLLNLEFTNSNTDWWSQLQASMSLSLLSPPHTLPRAEVTDVHLCSWVLHGFGRAKLRVSYLAACHQLSQPSSSSCQHYQGHSWL